MAILWYPYVKIRKKVIILSILSKLAIYTRLYVLDHKIKTAVSYEANEHFLESQ